MKTYIRRPFSWTLVTLLLFALISCRSTIKEEYYDNGTLKSSIEYKGKKKNGEAREYYPNGYTRSIIHYIKDVEDGLSSYYNQDGTITMDVEMKDGKKNGRMRTYFFTGNREMECFYKDDKLEGKQTYFDQLGNRVTEINYKNDIAEGAYTTWYSKTETINGLNAMRCSGQYKNGQMDGHWTYYDENEMPVGEADFQQGSGTMIIYVNGEKAKETPYVNNMKEGDEKEFDREGNVLKTTTYQKDRIVAINGEPISCAPETQP